MSNQLSKYILYFFTGTLLIRIIVSLANRRKLISLQIFLIYNYCLNSTLKLYAYATETFRQTLFSN
jgi:hypothetical protein